MPTLRTLNGQVPWVVCNGCQRAVEADQPALIAADRGDVPVTELHHWGQAKFALFGLYWPCLGSTDGPTLSDRVGNQVARSDGHPENVD